MADETVQDKIDALFDEPEVAEEPTEEVEEEVSEEVEEETEEATEETEEKVEEAPKTVELERDGKLYDVPVELQEAFMREGDYTQKTQEVASQRKELEIRQGNLSVVDSQYQFAMNVQDEVLKVHQLDTQIDQARTYMRENIEGMTHTDLEKIRMAIDETKLERDTIVNSVRTKNTEFQQARKQSLKELADKSTEVLRQKVPGWGDSHELKIKDYALSLGIPEQTYNTVIDPVEKLILHKAMQFDALQSGKAAAVEKVVSTPSIKAKARNPMPDNVKAKLKLNKQLKNPNLSSKAKARMIERSMGERYG